MRIKTLEEEEVASSNPITSVIPLFKVERGITLNSYGIECAYSVGVQSDIIQRAREGTCERAQQVRRIYIVEFILL